MIGGGYVVVEEVVYLICYGKLVMMIIWEFDFICVKLIVEVVKNYLKIKIVYNIEVKEIMGDDFVWKVVFVNN